MVLAYLALLLALIVGLADDSWLLGLGGLASAAMAVARLPTLSGPRA